MLTIQSDESRHMANGWTTLVTLLQDDRNLPLIQEVLDKWAWRSHVSFGVGNALFGDYFVRNRQESSKEMALRWVFDELGFELGQGLDWEPPDLEGSDRSGGR